MAPAGRPKAQLLLFLTWAAPRLAEDVPLLWPLPAEVSAGHARRPVCPHLSFAAGPRAPSADLLGAFKRFRRLVFPHHRHDDGGAATGEGRACSPASLALVNVTVVHGAAALELGVDESYSLHVGARGDATVRARTQYGVYHALSTLSQLVAYDFERAEYLASRLPLAVVDKPRFAHRELLLDSARHFLPMPQLLRTISAMAWTKLNVLHWHMVDSQSFPVCLPSAPELCARGAFSPAERYAPSDVAIVVEHARARGIRVIPELDVPGHTRSWCRGRPEVCPSAACAEPLNPAREGTFALLGALLDDLARLFPDSVVHLGGDEVDTACWEKSPEISEWLRVRGLSAQEAYAEFVLRAHALAAERGRVAIGWDEVFEHFGERLPRTAIVQQWRTWGRTGVRDVTARGLRALVSLDPTWYLDSLRTGWREAYALEPCAGLSDAECALVLGGGGEMWGETVDGADLEPTVWPRLAAIAERLWSPRLGGTATGTAAASSAERRLLAYRCLLLARGVSAAPVNASVARSAPSGPGGCGEPGQN